MVLVSLNASVVDLDCALTEEDKARKTTARIALEGGLIESLTGHVVGSASTTQSKEIEKYSRDPLAQLIVTDPGSRAVARLTSR